MIGAVLSNVVFRTFGYLYPAYVTYKDMKARNARRIYLWSMYWVILGFFTAALPFLDAFVGFLPLYHEARALFPLLLWYPDLQGAESVWRRHLDPFLASREATLDARIEAAKRAGAEAARGGAGALAILARQHGVAALLWIRSAILAALAGAVTAIDAQRGTVVFREIQGAGQPASPGGAAAMSGAAVMGVGGGATPSGAGSGGGRSGLGWSSPFVGASATQPSTSSRAISAARSGSSALPPLVDIGEDSFASGRAASGTGASGTGAAATGAPQRAASGGLFGTASGLPTSLPSVSRTWSSITGGLGGAGAGVGAGAGAAAVGAASPSSPDPAGAGAWSASPFPAGAPSPLSAPAGSWSAAAASAIGALAGLGSGALTPVVAAVMSSGGRRASGDQGAETAGGAAAAAAAAAGGGSPRSRGRASPRPPSPPGAGSPLRNASPQQSPTGSAGAPRPGAREGSLGPSPPRHSRSAPSLDDSSAQGAANAYASLQGQRPANAYASLQGQRPAAASDDPFGWLGVEALSTAQTGGGPPPAAPGGVSGPFSGPGATSSAWSAKAQRSGGGSERVLYPEVLPLRHDDPYVNEESEYVLGRGDSHADRRTRGLSGTRQRR